MVFDVSSCLVVPVGVTLQTVMEFVEDPRIGEVSCVIGVTVEGFLDVKEKIFKQLEELVEELGARLYKIVLKPLSPGDVARIMEVLLEESPGIVVVSLLSGSRYLYPVVVQAVLYYVMNNNAKGYMLVGVEGGVSELVPLAGFYVYRLERRQRVLFEQIYGIEGDVIRVKEDLIMRYGYGRSIYKVIRELERKGLILHGRNIIAKTFPGKVLYRLMKLEAGKG
ncbi:MAG: hypothetical protein GSR81_04685 [Desulfurococcales archaeon]|nr:hypothetical protein [Desulfurococcales archaeon]